MPLLTRESSFAREDHEVVLMWNESFPPGATNMTSKATGELRLNHMKILILNHCDL